MTKEEISRKDLKRIKNIKVTKWVNDGNVSYSLQKSWKSKDNPTEYENRVISIFSSEVDSLYEAVKQIKKDNDKME